MQPRTEITKTELHLLAGKCSAELMAHGVPGAVDEGSEGSRLVADVQFYLAHGQWSPIKAKMSIPERVRLAVIAGVCEQWSGVPAVTAEDATPAPDESAAEPIAAEHGAAPSPVDEAQEDAPAVAAPPLDDVPSEEVVEAEPEAATKRKRKKR